MPEAQSSALRGHSQPSTARPFSARFCVELAGSESAIAVFVVTTEANTKSTNVTQRTERNGAGDGHSPLATRRIYFGPECGCASC